MLNDSKEIRKLMYDAILRRTKEEAINTTAKLIMDYSKDRLDLLETEQERKEGK